MEGSTAIMTLLFWSICFCNTSSKLYPRSTMAFSIRFFVSLFTSSGWFRTLDTVAGDTFVIWAILFTGRFALFIVQLHIDTNEKRRKYQYISEIVYLFQK